ncbi:unnamed protein product, partial [Meganyctiphanes norvegica]
TTSQQVVLWEVYQAAPHLSQHVQELPGWGASQNTSFWIKHPSLFNRSSGGPVRQFWKPFSREPWHRRTDLSGLTVKCTTLQYPPFIIYKKESKDNIEITGIYGEIWN